MTPAESDGWGTGVDLEHLPREGGHHAFEGLVALLKVVVCRTVVLVARDDGIVGADLEHVVSGLRGAAVDREGVDRPVYGPPVVEVRLVRCFNLPVLDELLHEIGK